MDEEGYPRADVNLYQVRAARHNISCKLAIACKHFVSVCCFFFCIKVKRFDFRKQPANEHVGKRYVRCIKHNSNISVMQVRFAVVHTLKSRDGNSHIFYT